MKTIYLRAMILLGFLMCVQACAADSIRAFNAHPKPIRIQFYAERVMDLKSSRGKMRSHHDRTLIWYQSPERYRLEMVDFPGKGLRSYQVRSDDRMFYYVERRNQREKWGAMPASWVGDDLRSIYAYELKMRNATLLGIERIHGIQTEHWRGISVAKHATKTNILDIWLCTDKRFPLIVKYQQTSPLRSLRWELANLRLGGPVPDYMLNPQANPEGGILAQLSSRHRPLWMIAIWYFLDLLSFILLIYALTMAEPRRKRVLLIVAFGFIYSGLMRFTPGLDMYMNQYSGLPALVLIALMTAAAIVYSLREFKIPGDVRLFAGTRWPVIIWAAIMAGYGLVMGPGQVFAETRLRITAFPFLLPTLITILIYVLPLAALEEVIFRGYVTGLLGRRFSSGRIVNVLQALAFTALHIPRLLDEFSNYPSLIRNVVYIFIVGLILGGLRLKYRNLGASWIVHAAGNIGLYYAEFASTYVALNFIRHM